MCQTVTEELVNESDFAKSWQISRIENGYLALVEPLHEVDIAVELTLVGKRRVVSLGPK